MASITKRETSRGPRYDVRYRTPAGRTVTRTFARRREADRFARGVEVDKVRGEWIDPQLTTIIVEQVAAEWLGTIGHLKPKTIEGYESILSCRVLPAFGNLPVGSVDVTTVRRFCSEMLGSGTAHQTVKNTLHVLRSVLGTAVESRYIGSNPAEGVRLDRVKARSARHDRRRQRIYLDVEQVNALAAEMPEPYGVLVLFAAYTGVRAGELAGVQVGDIDFLRRRVSIERTVVEVHGELVEGDTKTGEPRIITLPAFLVDELARYLDGRSLGRDDWLWSSPTGQRFRHSTFYSRIFRPALERAGLPPARFHDLRHSCAAMLIAEGAHPKAIQERLGHSSIEITMDTYGHLYESVEDALAESLDARYRAAAAPKGSGARDGRAMESKPNAAR